MKVTYDSEVDVLRVLFSAAHIEESMKTSPDLPLARIGGLVEPGSGDSLTGGWERFNL